MLLAILDLINTAQCTQPPKKAKHVMPEIKTHPNYRAWQPEACCLRDDELQPVLENSTDFQITDTSV